MTINLDRLLEIISADEDIGICTECGAEHDMVEPDAEGYTCDACGLATVVGAEQLLITL